MATGYVAPAGDLDALFKARTSAAIANVNYKSNGGVDLAQRFEPRGSTTARANTNFKAGASDLSQLFMDIAATVFPLVRTYDTVVTNQTETVPAGAVSVSIEQWGAGGGAGLNTGPPGLGGGGGGYIKRILAVTGGQTFTFSNGAGGPGRPQANGVGAGNNGGNSNVVSVSPAFTIGCNGATAGGQTTGGTGGTVSNAGGTTSTAGGNGSVPLGGAAAGGGGAGGSNTGLPGTFPGGGGGGQVVSTGAGGAGAGARTRFTYT